MFLLDFSSAFAHSFEKHTWKGKRGAVEERERKNMGSRVEKLRTSESYIRRWENCGKKVVKRERGMGGWCEEL